MGAKTLEIPETIVRREGETERGLPWNVILYNDDVHSFDAVIFQVQKATGVSQERAFDMTMEAHTQGRALCFTGPLERCEHVAAILKQIRLTVEIERSE